MSDDDDDRPLLLYRATLTVSGAPRSDGVAPIRVDVLEYVEARDEAEAEDKALGRTRSRFHHAEVRLRRLERGFFVRAT